MTRQMTYMMLLPSATTASEQAQLTRAFFMQRSQGPFNSLFTGEMRERGRTFLFFVLAALSRSLLSLFLGLWPFLSLSYALSLSTTNTKKKKKTGNGFTATGVGAVFAGESTEFLFSPFFSKSLPPKSRATIQFCLNGVNGGVPINGDCKTLTPPAP